MFSLEPILITLFSILGASALIVLGTNTLSESLHILFKKRIFWGLSYVAAHPTMNALSGFFVTLFNQSPLATIYSAMSFGRVGLFNYRQMLVFMSMVTIPAALGLWLLSYNWGWYEVLFLSIGFYPHFFLKEERLSKLGSLFFGIGLLMLGTRLMGVGVAADPQFSFFVKNAVLSGFSAPYFVLGSFLLMAIFMLAFRSHLAVLVVVLQLFNADFIGEQLALYMIVMSNLCLAFPISWGWSKYSTSCKRALWHKYFAILIAAAVCLSLGRVLVDSAQEFLNLVGVYGPGESKKFVSSLIIPTIQLHFAGITFLVLMIGMIPIQKVVERIQASKGEKEMQKLEFFGDIFHSSPVLNLNLAHQEVRKMAAMVDSTLHLAGNSFSNETSDGDQQDKILKYESVTDKIQNEMNEFLSHLMRLPLSYDQALQVRAMLRISKELESIADCCKSIYYLNEQVSAESYQSKKEMNEMIFKYFESVLSYYELLFSDFTDEDESIFTNNQIDENFRAKTVDLRGEFVQLTSELLNSKAETKIKALLLEMTYRLDKIYSHTTNIYETYRMVEIEA